MSSDATIVHFGRSILTSNSQHSIWHVHIHRPPPTAKVIFKDSISAHTIAPTMTMSSDATIVHFGRSILTSNSQHSICHVHIHRPPPTAILSFKDSISAHTIAPTMTMSSDATIVHFGRSILTSNSQHSIWHVHIHRPPPTAKVIFKDSISAHTIAPTMTMSSDATIVHFGRSILTSNSQHSILHVHIHRPPPTAILSFKDSNNCSNQSMDADNVK
jgi:hypothetical protein